MFIALIPGSVREDQGEENDDVLTLMRLFLQVLHPVRTLGCGRMIRFWGAEASGDAEDMVEKVQGS